METHLAIQRLKADLTQANRQLQEHVEQLEQRNEDLDAYAGREC